MRNIVSDDMINLVLRQMGPYLSKHRLLTLI